MTTIAVERPDRLAPVRCRALDLRARGIVVLDNAEVDDDLVRDMTEIVTSFCARQYGRRSARRQAEAALTAAEAAG
ncbi:hypothetical protein [Dactylosporangium sp. CA-233914]|uniref:hypothetical protein n=1 Tax=Dactylosporangium sp. CA-233914 TaxID=3239934 RepID=UPI003D91725E